MALLGAVDPGLRVCGVSLFEQGGPDGWALRAAALVKSSNTTDRGMTAWDAMSREVLQWFNTRGAVAGVLHTFAGERMQVYSGSKQEGDPNDLIELAGVLGFIGCKVVAARYVTFNPRDWKDQTKKPAPGSDPETYVIAVRSRKRLTPAEQRNVELPSAKSLQHNVWDAVGIGLKAAGRFERHRVLAGLEE